ncbi:MAG: tetratricopeptide repeat protein [Elusimicrobiaceae bacterium]|nr:tetratricopeptide repeat protein [Elusimicrobiaceae bacterium]MBQ6224460.1 tetratricopeptide repeat protein [Campylobacter sp.]
MCLNRIIIFIPFLFLALNANALFGLKDRSEQKEQIAKAREAFAAENYPQTIKLMKEFTLKDAPKRRIKRAYVLIADSYIAMEEYDKAMLTLSEALEFYPKDNDLRLTLAEVYYICDLNSRAIEEYQKVLNQDKNNSKAILGLAQAMLKEGFYSKACQYFKRYIELTNSDSANVYYNYAQSNYMANNFEAALELALISLEQKSLPDTKLLIAKIYKSQGNLEKAFLTIRDAWLMDINREDIYLTYALWTAYDKAKAPQGLEMAKDYLKAHPQNRLALFIKFIAYTRLNEDKKAKETLKEISALKGKGFTSTLADKLLENTAK